MGAVLSETKDGGDHGDLWFAESSVLETGCSDGGESGRGLLIMGLCLGGDKGQLCQKEQSKGQRSCRQKSHVRLVYG